MSRHDRDRASARDEAIERILGERSEWGGSGVGVYGADVCALCGEIGTFRGWIVAAYGCRYGRQREFVCDQCRGRIIPKGESLMGEQHRLVGELLEDSRTRYCRLCRAQIPRDPRWGRSGGVPLSRLCAPCLRGLADEGVSDPEEISELLRRRVRRRFLELLDDRQLADMVGLVSAMREELDDQRAEKAGEKKPRLAGEGSIGIYPGPGTDLG